ncbi:hypothetical protein THRCLA_01025 [Thraustotheca clavata]|uniref:Uncharacterized protein n=1 Tax=Thraustotheca clavata TaxID=74557 RepID=A0A1W0A9I3_9STRA|nr:hypothetical protein THRCLA_01025 [Thraustotheca clavata]
MERKPKARGATDVNDNLTVLQHDTRSSRSHVPPKALTWRKSDRKLVPVATHTKSLSPLWIFHSLRNELFDMFLPAGYPASVTEDYLPFQLWDTCQAMCSYLRGVLATQSVLESVGVGNETITPLAAALQWVLRDGSGMLGGLFFAYGVGPKFDANVKFWRLYADVINDFGLTLDMLAPFFPNYVTQVLCISSVCKAMCGVAAGATRSSLTAHFAKQDNMADIAAKEGSQETFVTLLGLLFGMYFANAVNQSRTSVWLAFFVLTGIHVIANYKAVTSLEIPTLNQPRAKLAIQHFRANNIHLLSVREINRRERIWMYDRNKWSIYMGGPLPHCTLDLVNLLQLYRDEHYIVTIDAPHQRVVVSLLVSATHQDQIRAYFNAIVLVEALNDEIQYSLNLLSNVYTTTVNQVPSFLDTMESLQWKLNSITSDHIRYSFIK